MLRMGKDFDISKRTWWQKFKHNWNGYYYVKEEVCSPYTGAWRTEDVFKVGGGDIFGDLDWLHYKKNKQNKRYYRFTILR